MRTKERGEETVMSDNNDWFDDFMDYKMSSSGSSSSNSNFSSGNKPGGFRIPTWLYVIAILGIISGELPVNGFTVILALVFAGIVLVRILGS